MLQLVNGVQLGWPKPEEISQIPENRNTVMMTITLTCSLRLFVGSDPLGFFCLDTTVNLSEYQKQHL